MESEGSGGVEVEGRVKGRERKGGGEERYRDKREEGSREKGSREKGKREKLRKRGSKA